MSNKLLRSVFICEVFVVLLLLLPGALAASNGEHSALDARISHSYYFESHGRDDLREWRAAIFKGAQYLKIDFNFITDAELCRQQQELPVGYNFTMGCFLLVHSFDNITIWGDAAHTFNTTYNIVDWLSDDANLDVILLRPLVFQVCLKGKPNLCDGSEQAAQWIALVDAFYAMMQPILENTARLHNHVQFVFDQLNQADQCILERWRPWNSTWVGEPGTGEDNNDGGNATFQMVNMELSSSAWQLLNNTHMGKFSDGPYAMVAWEPVSEDECTGFFAYFRTFRYVNPAGVILAYNSDPSMFHVLTASETDRYSHFPFGPEQALTPVVWFNEGTDASNGLLFTISMLATDTVPIVLTVHNRMPRGKFSIVASVPIILAAGDASAVFGANGLCSMSGVALNATSVMLLVAGSNGIVVPIAVHFGSNAFVVDSTGAPVAFPCVAGSSGPFSVGFGGNSASANVLIVVTVVNTASLELTGNLYTLSVLDGSMALLSVWSGLLASNVVASEGLSAAVSLSAESGWLGMVVCWASARSVYTATAQGYYYTAESVFILNSVQPQLRSSLGPVKVGVGRFPSVSFEPNSFNNNATKLLLSYGWSFCYNDEFIDDDAFMMLAVKICDLRDASYVELAENPVNSYVFTSFADYNAEVAKYGSGAETQHRNGFATSCSDSVFHGVFDVGFNASIVLVPRSSGDVDINEGGYLGISAMTSLTLPTLTLCGEPQVYNGRAILDTFPLFGFYNQSAI